MGGYVITDFVEYKITAEMQSYLDGVYGKELPTPISFLATLGNSSTGHPIRAILLFTEPSARFLRLKPEDAKQIFCRTVTAVGNATVRESYNLTVIKSKLTRAGAVYEAI